MMTPKEKMDHLVSAATELFRSAPTVPRVAADDAYTPADGHVKEQLDQFFQLCVVSNPRLDQADLNAITEWVAKDGRLAGAMGQMVTAVVQEGGQIEAA